MKKYIFTIAIYLIVNFAFTSEYCEAQWEPDFRLTNNTAPSITSWNHAWCIASNGNYLHAVWYDSRDGNWEIYHKRSTDAGTTWGTDTRLTNNALTSEFPSISVSGVFVHIVWKQSLYDNCEIYYKRSTDNGVTWENDTRLTNDPFYSSYPSIAVSGSNVNVGWLDTRDGNPEIYYKRSTDGGINWGSDTRLTNNVSLSYWCSIASAGTNLHTVWSDDRDVYNEIYYKRSTDGGVNWGADIRLTYNHEYSFHPSIAISGTSVHVVWQDSRDGNFEIYYKRSTDGGVNWSVDTRLTNYPLDSYYPSVAVSGSLVQIVWKDYRDNKWQIYSKISTDMGSTWGTDTRLTNNSSSSDNASVTISGSDIHVVWQDNRDGNDEIYYKRNTLIPSAPVLFSPVNNSIGQSVNLNLVWSKPQYCTKYRLLLATDSLFTNVIVNDSLLTDSVKSISNLNPLTKYWWKVGAGNGKPAGWGIFSSVWNFTTVQPLPVAPVLVSPVNGAINLLPNVLLDWNAVQYAAGYRIQIASDSLFTSIVKDTSSVVQDTLRIRPGILLANSKYYWRVNATNVSGTGQWSTVWNFRINQTGLNQIGNEIPTTYSMEQNYPNPFNPMTKIMFQVPSQKIVKLVVFDILGKEVATLVNESLQPGTYEATFDAGNLASGIYFYRLQTEGFSETKKMLMIK